MRGDRVVRETLVLIPALGHLCCPVEVEIRAPLKTKERCPEDLHEPHSEAS